MYGPGCRVDEDGLSATGQLLKVDVRIFDHTNLILQTQDIQAYENGFFTGGEVRFKDNRRMIIDHPLPGVLKTLIPFPRDLNNALVTIVAGCAHTLDVCTAKFDNAIEYGGFPFTSKRDPTISILPG